VVIGGRAILAGDSATAAVHAGSVVSVAAGEHHTFTRITEDLTLLAIFAPACGSRQR
jgi:quercetin dioxygenase-like cupin family protein